MYTVAVERDFMARHFLFGGDWGAENEPHSHNYVVEVQLRGERLDEHGYLVDIVEIERNLDTLVAYFRDRLLNDLDEFAGLNPSIEHFSRIFLRRFVDGVEAGTLSSIRIKIWENKIACASYEEAV